MSSMPPTKETLRSPKTVSTQHSQEMGGVAGRTMPPLREEETTLHLTEERYSRVSLTPLLRRMAAQLMGVPITERCQRTGSAQQVQGKSDKNLTNLCFLLNRPFEKNRVLFKETNGSNYARYKHSHCWLALHCAQLVLDTDKPIYYRVQNASSRSLDSVPLHTLISITLAPIRAISIFSPKICFLLHLILFETLMPLQLFELNPLVLILWNLEHCRKIHICSGMRVCPWNSWIAILSP